jgi:hypothetical protein
MALITPLGLIKTAEKPEVEIQNVRRKRTAHTQIRPRVGTYCGPNRGIAALLPDFKKLFEASSRELAPGFTVTVQPVLIESRKASDRVLLSVNEVREDVACDRVFRSAQAR